MKKKKEIAIRSSAAEYLTFVASAGESDASFEMRYEDENIWLTQKMMGLLYNVETHTINYHLKKIFADGEIDENSVIRKFRITAADGKNYNTNHSALYDVGLPTINEHIKKIYSDGELTEQATIRRFRIVQTEGVRQVYREIYFFMASSKAMAN